MSAFLRLFYLTEESFVMIFRRQLSCLVALLYTSADVLGSPTCEKTPAGDCTYPSLINATSDQIQDGLNKGCFTSADLVRVCVRPYPSSAWLTVL